MKVKCSELLEKKEFESYSEFYLALCFANECKRRGLVLDMSDMHIEKNILPKDDLVYFKYLLGEEAIYLGKDETYPKVDKSTVSLYFDTQCLYDLKDVLMESKKDGYYWDIQWVNHYTKHEMAMKNITKMGNTLMHLVAFMLLEMRLNEIPKKCMFFEFSGSYSRSTYLYVNLFSCKTTLDWFDELVAVNIDLVGVKADIDYSIHCNNGLAAGRYKKWSVTEKQKILSDYGIVPGSIVIVWNRTGICESNRYGKITSAIVGRVDEIGDDFIAITRIPLNKTKEEVELDYYSIPEGNRYLFSDMLTKGPSLSSTILSLYEVGINNYFFEEPTFLTLLDKHEKVTKYITIGGEKGSVEMSGINAIYWLLCQYNIDFDRELFRHMYSPNKDLLWDVYGTSFE